MPQPRVKAGSLFYKNGKRVATLQGITYRYTTGDTQEMADSGTYSTDGVGASVVTADMISPVTGIGIDAVTQAVNKGEVDLVLGIFDGKIHTIEDARTTSFEFTGETASGKQTGKFEWFGGTPIITS